MFSDISELRSKAISAAQAFIGTTQTLELLGWGISGFVFLSPVSMTAIKVHHRPEGFDTEVRAYLLLRSRGISSIEGITIPKLRSIGHSRQLIEIDAVSPPFLLDFAGVKFSNPRFSPETMRQIYEDVDMRFGKNAHIAYSIQHQLLLKTGMYYLDLRPSNLNLQGLAGVDLSGDDDDL